jgi:adenylate cyclase
MWKLPPISFVYLDRTFIMPSIRQLAAIMFTDIAGYTSLMGDDEEKAIDVLNKNRQIQKPLISQFQGTWIKELGDGVLASFTNASDAVGCAISIQQQSKHIADLKLRIGIHLGEVLFQNDDVFGDGVNIASRIQAIAPIGGIWISEAVHRNISNKKEIKSNFIKEETLKHVAEPMRIYEIEINNVSKQFFQLNDNGSEPRKNIPSKSIAVLPFLNMSNDPEQEYFGEGIAEEILNSLAHLKDLKVAGRTSAFQFKEKNIGLKEIGEKLGVSTVLEGSVRKQGNRLRVTAQLIKVEDGFHLWSERYDREMDDIFAIQDEIALAITEKLKITLLQDDLTKITKTYTSNTEAYELYLKGRFHLNRRGAAILNAIQCFQKAIELDPDFALAYAGFADSLSMTTSWGLARPASIIEKAKASADKAIVLDATLSEPYCSLAMHYTFFERNWAEAKKNFLQSIELNPKFSQALYLYAWDLLSWVEGKFEEAQKYGEAAIKLDPLSSICYASHALILHTARKFEQALEVAQTSIDLDGNSFVGHLGEGLAYLGLQRIDEAITSFKKTLKLSNRHQFPVNALVWAYCLKGNTEQANIYFDELKQRSSKEYVSSTLLGLCAAYLNDADTAFEYLEKANADLEPILLSIKYEPWVPSLLKDDPRHQSLLNKIGYPK